MNPLDLNLTPGIASFRKRIWDAQSVSAQESCAVGILLKDPGAAEKFNYFLRVKGIDFISSSIKSKESVDWRMIEVSGTFDHLNRVFHLAADSSKPELDSTAHELQWLIQIIQSAYRQWNRQDYEFKLPRGRTWSLRGRGVILGIVNVTPDSFSDGGLYNSLEKAVEHGLSLLENGADALDVGGESTRPGSTNVSADEEIRRIRGVIGGIRKHSDCPISIDTSKAEVARIALEEGADIVNDVTALENDPLMIELISERKVPVVLMHMQGRPETMQINPEYTDVVAEVFIYLSERVRCLQKRGIDKNQFLVDPGFGFGKRSEDNLRLLRDLNELRSLGCPLLIGLSRKSFLGRLLDKSVAGREISTLVANMLAVLSGALVIRTHHVANALEMMKILNAVSK